MARLKLGPRFSEGARRLWLIKTESKLSHGSIAACFGGNRSKVSRVLWGDQLPDAVTVGLLQERYGISAVLWSKTPYERFEPPAVAEWRKALAEAGDAA